MIVSACVIVVTVLAVGLYMVRRSDTIMRLMIIEINNHWKTELDRARVDFITSIATRDRDIKEMLSSLIEVIQNVSVIEQRRRSRN